MKQRSFSRSSFGAVIAAIVFIASASVFAQTPAGKTDDTVSSVTADAFSTVKAEKVKPFSTYAEYPADTANKKEDSTDAVDTPVANPAQNTSGSKWEFGFAPYLYLSGLTGTVGVHGKTAAVDVSIGDVLSHFSGGFMGGFSARKGRFVMVDDLFWVKITEETNTPGMLYDTGKIVANITMFDPQAGISVVRNKRGAFDILGGLRVSSVKANLSFTTGILPGFAEEGRKTWAAPTIGGHGLLNLSPKVYLTSVFDIGGGFGTHVTGQFYGGLGYRIKPKVALACGYRYLKNDYSDDAGFVYDTSMSGLVMGMRFLF